MNLPICKWDKKNKYNLRGLIYRITTYSHKWNGTTWREAYDYAKWRVSQL